MHTRSLAFFVALLLLLFGSGFATSEQARSFVSATEAQIERQSKTDPSPHALSLSAGHRSADDPSIQGELEEGMDLPELVEHLADAHAPPLGAVRPGPHRMAIWRAPALDGLRRPPRDLPATA